ncbi:MAG TPA: enolase C-terminal domain-like protein, partial [Verrucomicrobiota bacterium]|nr:enolase C-terminal domain-like protein [Verrucomicrobiota bacterium]
RVRGNLRTAAGEGAHDPLMARNLMDFGGVGYIQIDAGRVGGITSAYELARHAEKARVVYVNHTFTTPLALSASLQPYAGLESSHLCEYPTETSALAQNLTLQRLRPDADGLVTIGNEPGLGITPNPGTLRQYLVPVEIRVGGRLLYSTPTV